MRDEIGGTRPRRTGQRFGRRMEEDTLCVVASTGIPIGISHCIPARVCAVVAEEIYQSRSAMPK